MPPLPQKLLDWESLLQRDLGKLMKETAFKRVVREAFRLNKQKLPPFDIVIRPRKMAREATSSQLAEELCSLLH